MAESTFRSDVREYQDWKAGKVSPKTTRGLVVSTIDPLYAGRVKVWIPGLHGANPYGETGLDDPGTANLVPGVMLPSDFKSVEARAALPWAKVLSQNLGPIADLATGVTTPAGCFTTPSVGTEVILVFENDDAQFPIVIGSIIHANEFRYSLARPLEYLPGIQLSDVKQLDSASDKAAAPPKDVTEYESLVSSVYNIRTASGSTLFMSDSPTTRSIVLEGAIPFSDVSMLTKTEEIQLAKIYPAFPTTASAAFSKRQLLSTSTTSPLVNQPVSNSTPSQSNSAIVSTVNVQNSNSAAVEQTKTAQAASDRIEKSWPVSGSPRFSTGLGKFGAQRPASLGGKVHTGIDVGANADGSTILLAPIDLYPLYCAYVQNVGMMLLCLGVDGYAHGFLHERLIYPEIANMCAPNGNPKLGKLIKRGTPLGVCGITEITNHNTGPHLHWEVFAAGNATTGVSLAQRRDQLRKQEPLPSGMVDPLNWMKFSDGTNASSVVVLTPDQAQRYIEYSALTTTSAESEYAKPAGLEMSLTAGKETVMLRHPSGSFIGFDPDGNILIYSCGDINFRVNRSITYDVFGAIMENAFAKFSRVKTVIKSWARINSQMNDRKTADSTMPEFFTKVEKTRDIDMANALAANLGNAFIIDSNNTLVPPEAIAANSTSSDPNAPGGMYVTAPVTTPKNFTITKWDTTLKAMYAKYITPNVTAARVFPDVTDFKALMLHESNGDPTVKSSANAIGLFQLKPIAFQDIFGYKLNAAELYEYQDGEKNIEAGFKYILKLVTYIRTGLTQAGVDPGSVSATDFRYLVTLAYNQGPTIVNKAILKAKQYAQPITYKVIENFGIVAKMFSKEGLQYVPTIEYIKSNTTKVV